jgi:hypothetical protein
LPFANAQELSIHFAKHGHKFGIATEKEYEKMADAFMSGAMNANTKECTRPNRTRRCRLDFVRIHFGVACINPSFVLTFYPVDPAVVAFNRDVNGFFTNECAR